MIDRTVCILDSSCSRRYTTHIKKEINIPHCALGTVQIYIYVNVCADAPNDPTQGEGLAQICIALDATKKYFGATGLRYRAHQQIVNKAVDSFPCVHQNPLETRTDQVAIRPLEGVLICSSTRRRKTTGRRITCKAERETGKTIGFFKCTNLYIVGKHLQTTGWGAVAHVSERCEARIEMQGCNAKKQSVPSAFNGSVLEYDKRAMLLLGGTCRTEL